MTIEQLGDRYFKLVEKATNSGLFDAIAHLDLYKLYGRRHFGDGVSELHEGRIEVVFDSMKNNGTGFEINTAGIRRGLPEYFPSMDIVNIGRKKGARIAALGSDSHQLNNLAFEFEIAAGLAYELFPYRGE
jgi:histidinol-phosphatase (PHP family)